MESLDGNHLRLLNHILYPGQPVDNGGLPFILMKSISVGGILNVTSQLPGLDKNKITINNKAFISCQILPI